MFDDKEGELKISKKDYVFYEWPKGNVRKSIFCNPLSKKNLVNFSQTLTLTKESDVEMMSVRQCNDGQEYYPKIFYKVVSWEYCFYYIIY